MNGSDLVNKKTLFFSNIIGNIMEDDKSVRFNNYMTDYLIKNIDNSYSMLFIEAPGLGGEENYLTNIIRCFSKLGISFKEVLDVDTNTKLSDIDSFYKNNSKILIFLMGGNFHSFYRSSL